MKQITAIIPNDKLSAVSDAVNDVVGGFTVLEGKGRGSSKRQTIRLGRGTSSTTAEYNRTVTVLTVVPDAEVSKVTEAISNAAYTGKPGDGIIIVVDVGSVTNIASKKSGEGAL